MAHFCDNEKCRLHKVDSEARTHNASVYDAVSSKIVTFNRVAVAYIGTDKQYSEYYLCEVCANVYKMFEQNVKAS